MPGSRAFTILEIPYHLGALEIGVGKGPRRIVASGADGRLAYRGVPAQVQHISLRDKSCEGVDAIVDLARQTRVAVRQAVEQQIVPVVVSGNCIACVGTLGGLDPWRLGIVWLDAHADFHTPATSRSGSLSGMALSVATGACHEELCSRIGYAEPVPAANVLLPCARDIEPGERERVEAAGFAQSAEELGERADSVYLHIDLDFLSPAESPGVHFRGPGGLPVKEGAALIASIMRELPVVAVGLTNYNPDLDEDGRSLAAVNRLLEALL